MSLSPQNPSRFMHLVPAPPTPASVAHLPLGERFRACVLLADIEQFQAKLEAYRGQEAGARTILAAALGMLAFRARDAKFRTETRQWEDMEQHMDELSKAATLVDDARIAHTSICAFIDATNDEIKEAWKELDALKAGAQ